MTVRNRPKFLLYSLKIFLQKLILNKNGAFQHVAPGLKPLQLTSELQQSKRLSMNNNLIICQFLLQIHQMASDDFIAYEKFGLLLWHFYGAFLSLLELVVV